MRRTTTSIACGLALLTVAATGCGDGGGEAVATGLGRVVNGPLEGSAEDREAARSLALDDLPDGWTQRPDDAKSVASARTNYTNSVSFDPFDCRQTGAFTSKAAATAFYVSYTDDTGAIVSELLTVESQAPTEGSPRDRVEMCATFSMTTYEKRFYDGSAVEIPVPESDASESFGVRTVTLDPGEQLVVIDTLIGFLDGDVIAVSGQNAASDGPVDHDVLDNAYRTAIDRAS